jgi:hypothetical protein
VLQGPGCLSPCPAEDNINVLEHKQHPNQRFVVVYYCRTYYKRRSSCTKCLNSAKLRSTGSINPRAVLSRVRPRYRHLLQPHRRSPVPWQQLYCMLLELNCLGPVASLATVARRIGARGARERQQHCSSASHLTVVLNKADHSGPSVCQRARGPCLLAVSRSACRPCGRQPSCYAEGL